MKTEKPQTYTAEFRESSVKLALESDQSIKTTADGLLFINCRIIELIYTGSLPDFPLITNEQKNAPLES